MPGVVDLRMRQWISLDAAMVVKVCLISEIIVFERAFFLRGLLSSAIAIPAFYLRTNNEAKEYLGECRMCIDNYQILL